LKSVFPEKSLPRQGNLPNGPFALWIIPGGAAYTLTDGYIASLSQAYGLPRFEPHVTVLAGIPAPRADEMRGLAGSLAPFQIRLARQVEYLDEYFRSLFLPAHQSEELKEAFSKASRLFGQENTSYYPHLSLAYGDLPIETKLEMIRELGEMPEIAFEAREISLVQASKESPVESWMVIERIPLFGHGRHEMYGTNP
jgi:2'-5' RNA ligase